MVKSQPNLRLVVSVHRVHINRCVIQFGTLMLSIIQLLDVRITTLEGDAALEGDAVWMEWDAVNILTYS